MNAQPAAPTGAGPVVMADNLAEASPKAPGRVALFTFGALLIALMFIALVLSHTDGEKTVTESPASTVTTSPATTGSGTTTTTTTPAGKTTKTTKTVPSEGLLLALLGTGAVLVLSGALYSRISAIKLPGGTEITLSADERKQVAEKVAEKAQEGNATKPGQVAHATAAALQLAHVAKAVAGGSLDEATIEQAVAAGLKVAGKPAAQDGGVPAQPPA